jgi:hypothetical protein
MNAHPLSASSVCGIRDSKVFEKGVAKWGARNISRGVVEFRSSAVKRK